MCQSAVAAPPVSNGFRDELISSGWLLPLGAVGLYGHSRRFESVVSGLQQLISDRGRDLEARTYRFPPVMPLDAYLRTNHLETMPDLLGSVHGFSGDDAALRELLAARDRNENWSQMLVSGELVLVPAACYPLYPAVQAPIDLGGCFFDIETSVFRREPSLDPARMQCFRQREYVCLGSAEQALAHRDQWIERGAQMLRHLGLDIQIELANDPFFGRGGKVMKASQREQAFKFELLAPVALDGELTAISSSNFHADHFGQAFGLKNRDGQTVSSACVGFGLERITLALLRCHGFNLQRWPAAVQRALALT